MTVKWFDDPEYKERMELPWLKDYLKKFPTDSSEREVMGLICTDNGILVITCQWKGFIFKREKRHDQLRQALEVWISSKDLLPRLIAKPVKGEKFQLGLDDEFIDWYWEETEAGKYKPVLPGGLTTPNTTSENSDLESNPFLPGMTPPLLSTPVRKRKPAPEKAPVAPEMP